MTEPYVRPDVRLFLDYLNALPGPKTYEAAPAEARADDARDRATSPMRRRANWR